MMVVRNIFVNAKCANPSSSEGAPELKSATRAARKRKTTRFQITDESVDTDKKLLKKIIYNYLYFLYIGEKSKRTKTKICK